MNTLIAYASKYGCTEKCANLIAKGLKNQVDIIDLKKINAVEVSKYDKVIIGGSIYIGKIQKEVTEFCNNYLDTLKEKPIGLFICGMQQGEIIETEFNQNFPQDLLIVARAKGYLGGEFLLDKMSFMDKIIVKKVSKVTSDQSNILADKIHEFAEVMNKTE